MDMLTCDCVSAGVLWRACCVTKYRRQFTHCLLAGIWQNDPNVCALKAGTGQGWRPSSGRVQEATPARCGGRPWAIHHCLLGDPRGDGAFMVLINSNHV